MSGNEVVGRKGATALRSEVEPAGYALTMK
jgi:hypothetical protein